MLYDIVHQQNFDSALPDHLLLTLIIEVASNYIIEASNTYATEVVQNYPDAQIF